MKKTLILALSAALLTGCGDQVSSQNSSNSATINNSVTDNTVTTVSDEKDQAPNAKKHSGLNAYMAGSKICDVLSESSLKQLFNITTELTSQQRHSKQSGFTCDYSWDATDRKAREQRLSAQGKAKTLSMRARAINHKLSIRLNNTSSTAANFVPPILSEAELQKRIEQAEKAAKKQLSDAHKAVAAANNMAESMIKKNNQNINITGVGDAAYWSKIGAGGLMVLDGDVSVYIAPLIADNDEEDIENAKKIFAAMTK